MIIKNGHIVNEGRIYAADLRIADGDIVDIAPQGTLSEQGEEVVDVAGQYVLPGIIDTHVHFREPGMTEKADIESESRAAAFGGVTSFFDMPNTIPTTTTPALLAEKQTLARERSHINYAFFYGATNSNADSFADLDPHQTPGIKLFMGSSTGNMLVDRYGSLLKVFEKAAQLDLPVVAHCEDSDIISRNMEAMKKAYGDDPDVALHPLIRSEEACYESAALAVQLAKTFGTRLHIAHVSTAKEIDTLAGEDKISFEAVVAHLLFSSDDYATLRARIKCNPAVKTKNDRDALRRALTDGRIATVATDHAPHLLAQKQGGCARAASGMPMVQFSLCAMLQLVDEDVLPLTQVVQLMAHAPAQLFAVNRRGFLRKGYRADMAIVQPHAPWTLTTDCIQSKCGWSPLEGRSFDWRVTHTICNGRHIFCDGHFDAESRGEAILFR